MNGLDETLTEMELDFLGPNEQAMSVDGMCKAFGNEHFLFLDVRTNKK